MLSFPARTGEIPMLAVLRVGDDEASASYARAIDKTCQSVGARFQAIELPANVQQADVEETVNDAE